MAACLGALHFPVWSYCPADKWRNLDTTPPTEKVTWFFEVERGGDEPLNARQVEKWWRDRAEFEIKQPEHPMVFMRKALEKYAWLTKLWHGNVRCEPGEGSGVFQTKDQILAACLMAHDYRLHSFDKPIFIFGDIRNQEVFEQYANFDFVRDCPTGWMRHAIEAKLALLAILKDPRCRWRETRTKGDPLAGGTILSMYEGISESDRELLEEKFEEL